MLEKLFGKRYSKAYSVLMSEESYGMATFVAHKGRLGDEKVTSSAMRWYDQLLNERNPKLAYDIAIKFNLPEQYIKHAKVEELRLKAKDIEDVSYKFIENAQELRLQADEIELSMSPDWVVCDKKVHKQIQSERKEVEKDGKPIVACDLDSGYFFRAQEAAKKELGKDVYYKIGLLVFENELSIGNDKYAELIANSYKIKEEDKRIITEAVKSRKVNNNTNA